MKPSSLHIASSTSLRVLPALVMVALVLMSMVVTSCREEHKLLLTGKIDPEKFPTMRTTDVSTLISDSGITRYRITAPLWLVFEESAVPQWKFPQGLHLEKFDDFFRRDATVDCDSAIYFKDKQLWRLDGYVNIANMQGEKFLTPQLFWDQRNNTIYSDSFIHIEKSDRIIEGYGFESDEKMTRYRVRNVSGIFPTQDFKNGGNNNGSDSATQVVTVIPGHQAPSQRRSTVPDSARLAPARPQTGPTAAPARESVAPVTAPSTALRPGGNTTQAPAAALQRAPSVPQRR